DGSRLRGWCWCPPFWHGSSLTYFTSRFLQFGFVCARSHFLDCGLCPSCSGLRFFCIRSLRLIIPPARRKHNPIGGSSRCCSMNSHKNLPLIYRLQSRCPISTLSKNKASPLPTCSLLIT